MPAEPPSDLEAEQRVLGAILLSRDAMDGLLGVLAPTDFAFPALGALYGAACDLTADSLPISLSTLCRQAGPAVVEGYGGTGEVAKCVEGTLPRDAPYWAERILACAKRRALLAASELGARLAQSEMAPEEAISRVSEALSLAITGQDSATIGMAEGVDLMMARVQRYIDAPDAITGLPTGWTYLDRLLDGLQPGCVTIVYAKTGAYKSTLVANIGWRLARDGVPGYWMTTEMPHVQVMERLAQLEAGLNFREIRYQRRMWEYEAQIHQAALEIRELPIWCCDRSSVEVGFLRGAVSRMKRQNKIRYVIVDLVDHVYSTKFRDDTKNESYVLQQMKDMAKREDVHVLLTTHIAKPDRAFAAFQLPYLELDAMKGSSSKSQDSDAAISLMVVRKEIDGFYKPMTRDEIITQRQVEGEHVLYAAVTKNRSGEQGNIPFRIALMEGARMMPVVDPRG